MPNDAREILIKILCMHSCCKRGREKKNFLFVIREKRKEMWELSLHPRQKFPPSFPSPSRSSSCTWKEWFLCEMSGTSSVRKRKKIKMKKKWGIIKTIRRIFIIIKRHLRTWGGVGSESPKNKRPRCDSKPKTLSEVFDIDTNTTKMWERARALWALT